MQNQSRQAGTEGRARRHALGHRRAEPPTTARTGAAVAVDARHHRLDRRQFDMVVGVKPRLISRRERVLAMRAALGPRLDDPIGVLTQRPEGAGMTLALLGSAPLGS